MRECGNWCEQHDISEINRLAKCAKEHCIVKLMTQYSVSKVELRRPKVILSSLASGLAPKFRELQNFSVTVGTLAQE